MAEEIALATEHDDLIEQTLTAMPGDKPADHAMDPTYVPAEGYDDGLEVE